MKKIRLTCSWCSDQALYDRFSRVYTNQNNKQSFEFTLDNNFDYLVIINGPTYNINFPKEKTLGVIMEPFNSPTVKLYKHHLEQLCNHIIWHYRVDSAQYIFYPGLLPYHMDYNIGNNLDYYLNTNFKKTKLCSLITSFNSTDSFPGCIYSQRVNFVKQILATNLDIDIYGNNWEHSGITDSRIKGTLNNKLDGLKDYKFSIAIENSVEKNYFTEKLTDCILTNTIPIYFGCPNIEKHFKTNPFFNLVDLDKRGLLQLEDILNNKSINNAVFDKNIMLNKYNLCVALAKYFELIT
jgi:hypothetical protein